MEKSYVVVVKAATDHDGTEVIEATEVENTLVKGRLRMDRVLEVVHALKNSKEEHNWPAYEYATKSFKELYPTVDEDSLLVFSFLVPHAKYGTHSITDVSILKTDYVFQKESS